MSGTIYDSGDLSDDLGLVDEYDAEELIDGVVTEGPETPPGMSFSVTLRGYTLSGIEEMVIQATATKLASGPFSDSALNKRIEDRAIAMVSDRIDEKLTGITAEIIDKPVIPRGYGKEEPVTMRDFIGLHGREYLEEKVDRDGRPTKGGVWGASGLTRAERLVDEHLNRHFKNEISKATSAMIAEMQKELKAAHASILEEEKARIRKALEREIGASA